MADDFPDLHHKLCKKTASLTTAFFYLNLKNDENDLIMKSTIEAYENEMDNIVQTANEILEKHTAENPQNREIKEIHAAYQKFKQEIEQERSAADIQFNNYKASLEEKYEQRELQVQELIKSHQVEVDDITEKLKYMQELVEKTIGDDVEQNYQLKKEREMEQKRMGDLLESKDNEIEELNKRYFELERMYKELEESRFLSGKRMSDQWSRGAIEHEGGETDTKREGWENEILKKKIVEQEKLIFALRNLVHENIIEDGEYAPSIEFEGGSNTGEMSALSVQFSALQKEAKNAKAASLKALKDKDDEIEKLRDKIKESGGDEKVQKMIEDYETRLKEASREHRKMIESMNAEYNDNMAEMEADFEKERRRWDTKEQGMLNILDSKNEYIAGLEEKIKSLEELSKHTLHNEAENREKEEQLSQEIQRLKNVLEDSRKIFDEKLEAHLKKAEESKLKLLEEAKVEKEKSLQMLREELMNQRRGSEIQKESKMKELEAQMKKLQEAPNNDQLSEEYQNKINDLSQRHNNYVRELMEKHEEKIQILTKQYEKELEDLSSALEREKQNVLKMKDEAKNSEIVNLKKDYEAKMHKISKSFDQQLQEKNHEFDSKLSAKDTEIATLKAEIEAMKDQLRNEKRKLEMKSSLYKDLKKKLDSQKSPSRSMQVAPQEKSTLSESVYSFRDRDSMVKIKEEDINGVGEKGKDQIIKDHLAYTEKMDKLVAELKKDHEEKISTLTKQLNDMIAAFNSRPSKDEDITYIRQLQEENFEKEEEIRRLLDSPKVYLPEVPPRRENYSFTKGFNSSVHLNNTSSLATYENKARKTQQKSLINPHSTASILPPISISQFTIQFRSPQPNSSLAATTKKFFK